MVRRVSSPVFVGRAHELDSLRAAIVRPAASEPRIVIIEGDAGIGKSRLVAELSRRARLDGALVLAGGALATGLETAPFGPIAEALRDIPPPVADEALMGMPGAARSALARLVSAVDSRDGARDAGAIVDAATIVDAVASTAGAPLAFATELGQGRLLEALLDFLGRLGARQPVVLVLEDLHWADRSTLGFLAFLSRNLRGERLLVVGTVRTDDLIAGQPMTQLLTELTRSGVADRMALPGLDRPAIRILVEAILGRVPSDDLVDAIHARSDGNPFYAEELLSATLDPTSDVSPTLREIVAGRLARVSERARRTLRAAAVAGAEIDPLLLVAATGASDEEIDEHLREGLDQNVLVVTGERLMFRHALVRETLYSDLLSAERRAIHTRMAQALEETDARDAQTAAALARHWDAGGRPERAFRAHLAAAELARSNSAPGDEQRYLERALELAALLGPDGATPVDLVVLRKQAAEAALVAGDFRRAIDLARSAVEQLPDDIDARTRGDHLRLLGNCLLESGDLDAAKSAVEASVATLAGPPSIELARALALLARMAMAGGVPDSPRLAEEARSVAANVGAPAIEADATDTLGVLLHIYGDSSRTLPLIRDALRIAQGAGDTYGVLRAQNNLATLLDEIEGRTREALQLAREGLATAERFGLQRTRGSSLATTVVDLSYRLGEWETVEALAGPAMAPALRGGFTVGPLFHLARVRLARGDLDGAAGWLAHVEKVGAGSLWLFNRGLWWILKARLELMRGRYAAGTEAVLEGLRIVEGTTLAWPTAELTALGLRTEWMQRAETSESDLGVARSLVERARSVGRSGAQRISALGAGWIAVSEAEWAGVRSEPSPELWAAAVAAWQRLECPYEEAYARLREGEALLYVRRPRIEAARTLGEAIRISRRLGAVPLRQEIERLARRGGIDLTQETVDDLATTMATREEAGPEAVTLEGGKAARPDASSAHQIRLSRRETEVLRLVAAGRTNGEIGRELFVTTKTASSHVAHILDKLGVSSRTEAAVVAERLGLLEVRPPA